MWLSWDTISSPISRQKAKHYPLLGVLGVFCCLVTCCHRPSLWLKIHRLLWAEGPWESTLNHFSLAYHLAAENQISHIPFSGIHSPESLGVKPSSPLRAVHIKSFATWWQTENWPWNAKGRALFLSLNAAMLLLRRRSLEEVWGGLQRRSALPREPWSRRMSAGEGSRGKTGPWWTCQALSPECSVLWPTRHPRGPPHRRPKGTQI